MQGEFEGNYLLGCFFFLYDVCNFDNDSRRGRKGSRKGFSRGTKILRVLKWSI